MTGLVSQHTRRTSVDQGNNGLSRGDRNRNVRLAVLRAAVPRDHAILGIDLAQSRQGAVLADHDSRLIARWRPRCSPWKLGELLERALRKAISAGFAGITVACEPTGHRWMVISQLAAERGMPMVCVQPLVTARAREAEDYTRGKSDDRDAVLIARLVAQLHCYLPEQSGAAWARLRHLGARRSRLIESCTACVQQLRDLLEVAWPAVLQAAADPLGSSTWLACLSVALAGGDGDLAAVHAAGREGVIDAGQATRPSPPQPAPRCPPGVPGGSAPGSPPPGTRRWPAKPGSPPSGPARWSARPLCWVTGRCSAVSWPTSATGCCRPWASWGSWRWPGRFPAYRRCPSPRSWPRPATRPGSPPPARWSSTQAWPRARTPAATTPASPASPAAAGPHCGWPPGGPSGAPCATTPSTPPGTPP